MGVNLVQRFSIASSVSLPGNEPLHLGRVPVCSSTQWTSPSNLNPQLCGPPEPTAARSHSSLAPTPAASREMQSHKASVRAEHIYSMICEEKKQLVIHLVCPHVFSCFNQPMSSSSVNFVDCSPPGPWDSRARIWWVTSALLRGSS